MRRTPYSPRDEKWKVPDVGTVLRKGVLLVVGPLGSPQNATRADNPDSFRRD
jgi:hypothetical protein